MYTVTVMYNYRNFRPLFFSWEKWLRMRISAKCCTLFSSLVLFVTLKEHLWNPSRLKKVHFIIPHPLGCNLQFACDFIIFCTPAGSDPAAFSSNLGEKRAITISSSSSLYLMLLSGDSRLFEPFCTEGNRIPSGLHPPPPTCTFKDG